MAESDIGLYKTVICHLSLLTLINVRSSLRCLSRTTIIQKQRFQLLLNADFFALLYENILLKTTNSTIFFVPLQSK